MGSRKISLNIPPEEALYFAISCADTIHKLSWQINSSLKLNLIAHIGFSFNDEVFPIQYDESTHKLFSIGIIKNKMGNQILIKELKNIDYILVAKGSIEESEVESLIANLKKIEGITAIIPIFQDKVKSLSILVSI